MYLYIKGFRTIREYECELQSESITLISGPSGVGKTTIMNAIYWCLYGTLKNVRKFGSKTGNCIVKIQIDNIKITRSKSPESLLYDQKDSFVLKDKEAQEKIDDLFGKSDVWLSCCYLRQGSRNRFIESSPSDRLQLLSELCFSTHSPETYVEKIEERTKELSKEFERENDFYKRDLEGFQKKRKEYPEYKKDFLTEEQKKSHVEFIHSDILSELENKLSTMERLESSYLSLLETKTQLENKFPNYKEYLFTEQKKNALLDILRNYNLSKMKNDNDRLDEHSPNKIMTRLESDIQTLERQHVLLGSYWDQFLERTKQTSNFRDFLISEDDITKVRESIRRLPIEIEEYERELRESERRQTNYEIWKQQLKDVQEQIASLRETDIIEHLLDDISLKIQRVKRSMDQRRRLDELREELEKYDDVMRNDIEMRKISMDEITHSLQMEKKILERRTFLESLSLLDQKDIVQKGIDIRRRVCEVQTLWNYVYELQDLESRIDEYDGKIVKLGKRKDWISEEELPKKILELNSAKELLICPKCSTSLRFVSNHLVECPSMITRDKIEDMSKYIEDSKRRIEYLQEKKRIEDVMNEKLLIFETKCRNMNLTSDGLYDYPKLEESEKEKLLQEVIHLEGYLSTYDVMFEGSERLKLSQRKWDAKNIQEKIDEIMIDYDGEICYDIEKLEKERESLILERSRRKHFHETMQGLEQKLRDCIQDESFTKTGLDFLKGEMKKYEDIDRNYSKSKEIFDLEKKIRELIGSLQIEKDHDNIDLMDNSSLGKVHSSIDRRLELKRQELEERRLRLEKERRECEEAREQIQLCENAETIDKLEKRMNDIIFESPKEIKCRMMELRTDIEDRRERLRKHEKAEELMREKKTLESQRQHVIDLSNRVSVASMMKTIANELEHKRMVSILNTINDFANEILIFLFDEPIKIEFMVYKTSKAKDKVKPSIVYKILYRGYEMDHVDQLSGGEGDRVSLAVTCALFQFSKFPFLLLDEFASSLDLNTKEMAIKSLKTFLGIGRQMDHTKSILCISHDTVEGLYDYTVKLSEC